MLALFGGVTDRLTASRMSANDRDAIDGHFIYWTNGPCIPIFVTLFYSWLVLGYAYTPLH